MKNLSCPLLTSGVNNGKSRNKSNRKEGTKMRMICVVVSLLLVGVSLAQADSIRCPSGVVSTGDTKIDVISKCGNPDYSEVGSVKFSESSATAIETWYYNCGDGRFNRTLKFKGSKLVEIKSSGTYGSGPPRCE